MSSILWRVINLRYVRYPIVLILDLVGVVSDPSLFLAALYDDKGGAARGREG